MPKPPDLSRVPDADLYAEIGRRRGRKQTPHAGPGRPRSKPRCPCGAMTIERAAARRHVCETPQQQHP